MASEMVTKNQKSSVHVSRDTLSKMNELKWDCSSRHKREVSHDELINFLLDFYHKQK